MADNQSISAQNTACRDASIVIRGVSKKFGKVAALHKVDLTVESGTIVALLGPNGAGKTTLVRILTTLLKSDTGTATVAGYDVVKQSHQVRSMIGLAGQYPAVDENLTGRENLEMIGQLYHLNRKRIKARTRQLLKTFELTEAANRKAKTYSGGMRRRLDLQAIPQSCTTGAEMSLAEFIKATKTASIFAREGSAIVRLQITPGQKNALGQVVLSARAEEVGDDTGEVDAVVTGEEAKIAFNSKYLADALSVLHTERVLLEITGPSSPGVLKPVGDENYIHVVMPMFVQW